MYQIRFLGESCITKSGKQLNIKSKRIFALLALVSISEKPMSRKQLQKYLWSSEDAKTEKTYAKRLRVLIYSTKEYCDTLLTITPSEISLKNKLDTDIGQFGALIKRGNTHNYKKAIELYNGDFMQDFSMRLLPIEFEDWLEHQRSLWKQQVIDTLDIIINELLVGKRNTDPKEAMYYVQKSLSINPWRDEVQLQLAQLYIKTRQPFQAKKQLENYIIRLKKHLDIEAGEDIHNLLKKLSFNQDSDAEGEFLKLTKSLLQSKKYSDTPSLI